MTRVISRARTTTQTKRRRVFKSKSCISVTRSIVTRARQNFRTIYERATYDQLALAVDRADGVQQVRPGDGQDILVLRNSCSGYLGRLHIHQDVETRRSRAQGRA